MRFRALGRSEIQVSALGLGCNNFGIIADTDARAVIHKALDLGVNFFDTADVYAHGRSEEILGQILSGCRNDVILATKFGHPASVAPPDRPGSAAHIAKALEASLKRLKTDRVDLYQMHFPDGTMPIEETFLALEKLIRQGKVRHIGCSNFSAEQIRDSEKAARSGDTVGFASCQNEYSLLARDAEAALLPAVRAFGMGFLPCFPLASGLLTGKYARDMAVSGSVRARVVRRFSERFCTDENWKKLDKIMQFCGARQLEMGQLAIAWLLANPLVSSVIAGATSVGQVEQNIGALTLPVAAEGLLSLDRLLCEQSAPSIVQPGEFREDVPCPM